MGLIGPRTKFFHGRHRASSVMALVLALTGCDTVAPRDPGVAVVNKEDPAVTSANLS